MSNQSLRPDAAIRPFASRSTSHMESLEQYFESFAAAFPEADVEHKKRLQAAFHAGAMAVCAILSHTDSEHYPAVIKELQEEDHAFGKKEL